VESVAWRTITRLPRPIVLTGAAGREAFVRVFSGDVIINMLGPKPMQERFRLVTYYLTDLAFQASGDGPWAGGNTWSGTPRCTPVDNPASRTTR
jgi:hypothetical protein